MQHHRDTICQQYCRLIHDSNATLYLNNGLYSCTAWRVLIGQHTHFLCSTCFMSYVCQVILRHECIQVCLPLWHILATAVYLQSVSNRFSMSYICIGESTQRATVLMLACSRHCPRSNRSRFNSDSIHVDLCRAALRQAPCRWQTCKTSMPASHSATVLWRIVWGGPGKPIAS